MLGEEHQQRRRLPAARRQRRVPVRGAQQVAAVVVLRHDRADDGAHADQAVVRHLVLDAARVVGALPVVDADAVNLRA